MNTWLLVALAVVVALVMAYWRGRRDGHTVGMRQALEAASKAGREADERVMARARENAATIQRQAEVEAGKSAAQSPIEWANDSKWRKR